MQTLIYVYSFLEVGYCALARQRITTTTTVAVRTSHLCPSGRHLGRFGCGLLRRWVQLHDARIRDVSHPDRHRARHLVRVGAPTTLHQQRANRTEFQAQFHVSRHAEIIIAGRVGFGNTDGIGNIEGSCGAGGASRGC